MIFLIDSLGKNLGLFNINDAKKKAFGCGCDIRRVDYTSDIPVFKIVNIGRENYKKNKILRSGKKSFHLKEFYFNSNISEHDILFKVNLIKKLLKSKANIKILIRSKSRVSSNEDSNTIMDKIIRYISSDVNISYNFKYIKSITIINIQVNEKQ